MNLVVEENDRAVLTLTMLGHATVHTFELSIPLLLVVWIGEFGVTAATIGIIVAIGYALFGIGALPAGVLADAYGRQPVIVACLAGMAVAFVLVSFASSLIWLTVGLALWGMAASAYHPAGLSLISTSVADRGRGFAYHGMAGNVGTAFGPFMVALLLLMFNWRTVVLLVALPAAVGALVGLRLNINEMEAIRTDGGDFAAPTTFAEFIDSSRHLFAHGFVLVFAVVILEGLFYRGVLTFLPQLLAGAIALPDLAESGLAPTRYVYAGFLTVGLLGQYVGGHLTDRKGTQRMLALAYVAMTAATLLFVPATAAGLATLLLISGILGILLFGEQPLLQATVAEYSDPTMRGLSYGYMYFGTFGVGALGAAVAGIVLSYATPRILFGLLASIALLAASLAWRLAT
jgi:MFS family permease